MLSRNIAVEVSARVEYALLALLEMVGHYQYKDPLKISEITMNQSIPERYLEQIFTNLRRSGIVKSQRGARGGYVLAREPWQITLLDIVMSVEGDRKKREVFSSSTVERNLVYDVWQQVHIASQSVLSRYTLEDLHQRCEACRQINPMYHI